MNREEALIRIKELEDYIKNLDSNTIEGRAAQMIKEAGLKPSVFYSTYGFVDIQYGSNDKNTILSKSLGYIKVPLPQGNREWSMEAFKWAYDFMNFHKNSFHNNYVDDKKFIYIEI